MKNKDELVAVSLLVLVLGGFLLLIYSMGGNAVKKPETAASAPSPFNAVNLTAKAAIVVNVTTGEVLFQKNADERLPLASLTKVMTALVASTLSSPDQTIVVSKEAIDTEGDSGLGVGEKWTLKNLLDFSLVTSANDGMRAIALALAPSSENQFISNMNTEAQSLGMKNTYYLNDTGLDQSATMGGAYGTARDMATLFEYILKNYPHLLAATEEQKIKVLSLSNVVHTAQNTDTITNDVPGLLASKTGYTDLAGGNLIIAFDPGVNDPFVVSVLGSTESARFTDMLALVDATLESAKNGVTSNQ